MALARDTGAYKDCQALLKQVVAIVAVMPRTLRYNVGDYAIKSCIEMLTCIQMANLKVLQERLQWFDEFFVYEERLRTLMEVGIDSNIRKVQFKRIAEYDRLLTNVGRQIVGWRKATQNAVTSEGNRANCQS